MRLAPRLSLLVALCAPAACGGGAPPAPVTIPPPPPPAPAAPPPPRAVWLQEPELAWIGAKPNGVGPRIEAGTVLLVGGRVALLGKDGSLRANETAWPAPVTQVIEVPPPAGGPSKLVVRAGADLYRLDDPLGAPVPLAHVEDGERVLRIAPGPGLLAFWDAAGLDTGFDTPELVGSSARFLDLDSGEERDAPPGFAGQPVSAMAFRTPREGAAVLRAVGLAVTTDGGTTWRPVARSGPLDDDDPRELALERGTVVQPESYGMLNAAFGGDVPGPRPIDLASGTRGAQTPTPAGPPMVQWIRRTDVDARLQATQEGVPFPSGDVLVLYLRTLARVVPSTGLVTDVAALPAGGCTMAGTTDTAWVRCYGEMSRDEQKVYRVPLREGPLTVERDVVLDHYEGGVIPITSPSGGVMFPGACTKTDGANVCVRQPDGSWKTVALGMKQWNDDRWAELRGPLADGRVVFGRSAGAGAPASLTIVARDAAGKEETLAVVGDVGEGRQVMAPLRELADHSLAALLAGAAGAASLLVAPGAHAARLEPVAHAGKAGGLAGAHGVILADTAKALLVTDDGGATWSEQPIPGALGIEGGLGDVKVSGAGTYFPDRHVGLLGWAFPASLSFPTSAPVASGEVIGSRATGYRPGARVACHLPAAPKPGAPPKPARPQKPTVRKPLDPPFPPAPKAQGQKRVTWGFPLWPTEPQAALDLAGSPDAPRATLRWFDPNELGAAAHAWSGRLEGIGWPEGGVTMFAEGGAVLVETRAFVPAAGGLLGKKPATSMLRVSPDGRAWMARVPDGLAFEKATPGVVALGRGDAPAAWTTGDSLVVWRPGEAPRVLASISERAKLLVGEPTRDAVPVVLTWTGGSLFRWLKIPPPGQSYGRDVWLTGWQDVPEIGETSGFHACSAQALAGMARFHLTTMLELGGDVTGGGTQRIDVWVAPGQACLGAFTQTEGGDVPEEYAVTRANLVTGQAERFRRYHVEQRLACKVGKP